MHPNAARASRPPGSAMLTRQRSNLPACLWLRPSTSIGTAHGIPTRLNDGGMAAIDRDTPHYAGVTFCFNLES